MAVEQRALRLWERSAPAWIARIKRGEITREYLLDGPMLALAGTVDGQQVLDVGCGEGRFCRLLGERGARTTGLDPTPGLLAEARRRHTAGSYVQGWAESLPFANASFHLVVSYLSLLDIAGFRPAIAEMARVLRTGGQLLIANMNSFATTREPAWHTDWLGRKLHVAVDNYFQERAQHLEWDGLSIINWHRPFEAYLGALLAAGLRLDAFVEPRPTRGGEHRESLDNAHRVPLFHVMRWVKADA